MEELKASSSEVGFMVLAKQIAKGEAEKALSTLALLLKDNPRMPLMSQVTYMTLGKSRYLTLDTGIFLLYHRVIDGEDEYLLSFTINKYKIEIVAYFTNILTLLFHSKLVVDEENFITDDGKLYFGDKAYAQFEAKVYAEKGMRVCEACNRAIPFGLFEGDCTICKICTEMEFKEATFH